jgi:hypothetical protein
VRKVLNNGPDRKVTSNDRRQRAAPTGPLKAVITGPAEASPIDQVEETTIDPAAALVIWTARPRIGPAVDKEANASRTSNAAALIAPAAEDSAVIASVAAEALAEEDSADLVEAAVDLGAADDK